MSKLPRSSSGHPAHKVRRRRCLRTRRHVDRCDHRRRRSPAGARRRVEPDLGDHQRPIVALASFSSTAPRRPSPTGSRNRVDPRSTSQARPGRPPPRPGRPSAARRARRRFPGRAGCSSRCRAVLVPAARIVRVRTDHTDRRMPARRRWPGALSCLPSIASRCGRPETAMRRRPARSTTGTVTAGRFDIEPDGCS